MSPLENWIRNARLKLTQQNKGFHWIGRSRVSSSQSQLAAAKLCQSLRHNKTAHQMPSRNEFQLGSGRMIRLVAIDQWGTYTGLLEGIPTKEMNERHIRRTMDTARERWHFDPYLIQPIETPIELDRDYTFGTPASIPAVTCVGQFDCFDTARDNSMDGSTLPIVWFQDDFAFPVDDVIQQHIQSLDWEQHASDFQY